MTHKAKDPAASAIANRVSSTTLEGSHMNNTKDTTEAAAAPARNYNRPADADIVSVIREETDIQISELRLAAMVLDEYVNMEISAGRGTPEKRGCLLTETQISGILYMLMHVRTLARLTEQSIDAAFGREIKG
jgi:hypothetical protein